MERGETSSGGRLERRDIERNRRLEMKNLCLSLVSFIPDHHFTPPKEFLSQPDQVDQATAYIKNLRERIEELRRKKAQATDPRNDGAKNAASMGEKKLPVLKINELGSGVAVVLISGLNKNFMLHQVISIIDKEGAEVGTVSISTVGDKVFHTLHAQAKIPRVGVDTSRISERIQELIS